MQKLFSILRCSLWCKNYDGNLSADVLCNILKLAKEQTVLGLVFDTLNDIEVNGLVDKMPIYDAIGKTEQIKQQNRQTNHELVAFADKCDNCGQNYIVVKGQTIASIYPNPALRQPGDIDFLVPTIHNINHNISKLFPGVVIPKRLSEKEFAFDFNNIRYELHSRLIDFGCKNHQRIWENLILEEWGKEYYVVIGGMKVRTLSPTANAIYLFLHLYFHLIREGVSLRQLCDWAIVLHHYKDEIDRNKLVDVLCQLDMTKGYKAFGSILVDELGLPESDFPMKINEGDRQWKEKILYDIFKGGNFGKRNHKAKSALGFKIETFRMAVNNSIRYYNLAPSEMRMMIPKMIKINLKLLFG